MWRGTTSVGRATMPRGNSGKPRSMSPPGSLGAALSRTSGMSAALVWLRRDLRIHDHPPLHAALAEHDRVVPVFVLDPALLGGRFPSGSRTAWMLACLHELDGALRERGAGLVVREGEPRAQLAALADEVGAQA